MSKCILLVRVSTQHQDFDEQEKQLYEMALKDGYKDNEIIAICEKESGIKLKEDERKGLNRMKEVIATEDITCVYAWEVSRIGRKKKVIFSIVEYLTNREVQLIVKEPYIRLLNDDKTINDGAETVLTLFAQIAESEMRNKQSRWQRTRKANAEIGKWNGGKNIKFGYTLDNDNFYKINEDEAKIIRLAYELYTTHEWGQTMLRKELVERGYKLSLDRVQKMMSDIGYTGEPYTTVVYKNGKQSEGYTIKYPQIISMELFKKAEAKRLKSNVECYRGQSFYFARNLFRCPACGYAIQGYKTTRMYMCLAYKHDNKDIKKCYNGVTININLLDSLLAYVAKTQWAVYRMKNTQEYRQSLQNELETTMEKFRSCTKELEGIDEKLEKIGDLYTDGIFNKDKYQSKVASVKEEAEVIRRRQQQLSEEYFRIQRLLGRIEDNKSDFTNLLVDTLEAVKDINEIEQINDIVHQFIKSVAVQDTEHIVEGLNKKSKTKKVSITRMDGVTEVYYAYNFGTSVYKFWNENKKPIRVRLIERKLGR